MQAIELKRMARAWLRTRYPDAHILNELSVAPYGGALVDVAAILRDRIVGVEIKGEGDGPARLGLQGGLYSRVCREMWMLCAPSIEKKCSKYKPHGWGILRVDTGEKQGIGTDHAHDGLFACMGQEARDDGLALAVGALVEMVWSREMPGFRLAVGGELAQPKCAKRKPDIVRLAVETVTPAQAERAVCAILREREWTYGPGGSIAKPVERPSLSEAETKP